MTALGRTVFGSARELLLRVTLDAFGNPVVQSEKRPIGIIGMVEAVRFPNSGLMALITSIPQAAQVQRIGMTANATLHGRVFVLIVDVTIDAFHFFVSGYKRPRPVCAVVFLYSLSSDFHRTTVFMTL